MKLSDEQIQQVMDHFTAKTGYFACPMCDGEAASVGTMAYTAPEFKPASNGASSGDDMPLVAMTCDNCGHVLLFSAEVLGVI